MRAASDKTIDDLTDANPDTLAKWYSAPENWVRSNTVLSLDGSFTDRTGRSVELSSAEDLRVLRVLRAMSEVIVVGGFTARNEPYVPGRIHSSVAHLALRPPRLAVVSRTCDFDPTSTIFSGSQPPLILTSARGASQSSPALREIADIVVLGAYVSAASIVDALRDQGLTRILVEAGPAILGMMRTQGRLDEIAVTVAPVVVGKRDGRPAFGTGFASLRVAATGRLGDQVVARLCPAE